MSCVIEFRNIQSLEHLRAHLRRTLAERVEHFIPDGRFNLSIRVQTPRARKWLRQPRFLCEAILTAPSLRRPVVIKRKNESFFKAVKETSRILEKKLRRESGRRQHFRRRVSAARPVAVSAVLV